MACATQSRVGVTAWSMAARVSAIAGIALISTSRLGLFAGQAIVAQGANQVAKKTAGPTSAIAEIQGLVAKLEAQLAGQRGEIQRTEQSLRRARMLLGGLERGQPTLGVNGVGPLFTRSLDPFLDLQEKYLPEQSVAEQTPWSWPSETATPQACACGIGGGYEVAIVEPRETDSYPTIQVRKNGKDIFAWRAHEASVFVRSSKGDTSNDHAGQCGL